MKKMAFLTFLTLLLSLHSAWACQEPDAITKEDGSFEFTYRVGDDKKVVQDNVGMLAAGIVAAQCARERSSLPPIFTPDESICIRSAFKGARLFANISDEQAAKVLEVCHIDQRQKIAAMQLATNAEILKCPSDVEIKQLVQKIKKENEAYVKDNGDSQNSGKLLNDLFEMTRSGVDRKTFRTWLSQYIDAISKFQFRVKFIDYKDKVLNESGDSILRTLGADLAGTSTSMCGLDTQTLIHHMIASPSVPKTNEGTQHKVIQ